MVGAHLQCVNNHYRKYEYKVMNTFKLQITQTWHPQSISDEKKMPKLNTPQK